MAENTNTEREALEAYLKDCDKCQIVPDVGGAWHAAFQAGRASLSLPAAGQEPVAHLWQHGETGRTRIVLPDMIVDADASWQVVGPLYLGAAPQPAVAAGWVDEQQIHMAWRGALKACGVSEADRDAIGAVVLSMLAESAALPPAPSTEGESNGL